ncbi:hypothetical protein [Allokutzneria albata]|uniref:DUF8017 domain-containing protein n=1 Tax=Allokutzneria albata TaxID=211114 RepID=A0A1G9UDZ9_ALLAB|nr:hypothetical protein [Allokutzneria albata]SDM58160.1 hypothetical protein SAMN04489726_2358 [Allokutzneria albata]
MAKPHDHLAALALVVVTAAGCTTATAGQAVPETAPPSIRPSALLPLVSGWTPVISESHGLAYDVPPDWKVRATDAAIGFQNDDDSGDLVAARATATYRENHCVSANGERGGIRGLAGLTKLDAGPLATEATNTAKSWAELAFRTTGQAPGVTLDTPVTFTVNGMELTQVTAHATAPKPDACTPSKGAVRAAVVRSGRVAATLVISTDRGIPEEVPEAHVHHIITSLRPLR